MTHSQWRLLAQPGFLGLWLTQMLGALNDNILKSSVLVFITYSALDSIAMQPGILSALAAGLLIFPFFMFSGLAGDISDKYEKSRLIRQLKILELFVAILVAITFYTEAVWGLFAVIFCMGCQSAFFGPLKYSAIPQLTDEAHLVAANGLINAATFVSILLGTIIGSLYILSPNGTSVISTLMIITACLGIISSLMVPKLAAGDAHLDIRYNFLVSLWHTLQFGLTLHSTPKLLGFISWFWFLGATILSQLPNFSKSIIHGDETCVTYFLCLFTLGVGLGSLGCNMLLKSRISLKLAPWAAMGLTMALIDWGIASSLYIRPPAPAALVGIESFLSSPQGWRISIDLFALSAFGGMYIVPFYAVMMKRIDTAHRARIIGCLNIVVSFWMATSSLLLMILFDANIRFIQIIFGLAVISLIITGLSVKMRMT
ncbi:MAG: hypothetical protein CMF48_06780 [Legionellales bacterium]|nr:hypothetical protein [Legionellales bacterium]|tara:strand:- start:570 stop:1856 length:1287 start_codon:yes stop_codon:yes gene_type:complete